MDKYEHDIDKEKNLERKSLRLRLENVSHEVCNELLGENSEWLPKSGECEIEIEYRDKGARLDIDKE